MLPVVLQAPRYFAIASLVLLAACIEPPDERLAAASEAITNASDDDADTAVVAIMAGDTLDCTGTLIGPTLVLTAAHCLHDGQDLSIHIGLNVLVPDAVIPVVESHAHPAFDPVSVDNDIAVLVLASAPDGVTPMAVATANDDLGMDQPLRVAGFGRTGPIIAGPSAGTRRTGTAAVANIYADRVTVMPAPSQPCAGDSGGPAFANGATGERVVAVTSRGDAACTTGAVLTRVSAYASFLAPWLGHPAGGCSVSRTNQAGSWALAIAVAIALRRSRRSRRVRGHITSA